MQIPNGIQSPGPAEAGRPIGYWLKHLDRLIDDSFSRALAADELTRRHWQVLNTAARGPARPAELTQVLEPFLRGDPAQLDTTVDDLISRGWVSRDQQDRLCLTAAGRTAHQMTRQRVQQTRDLLLRGVSADQYAAVIGTLAQMAANLQTSAA
jgi:DNA-binding MarR family transcriptional regulator